MNGVFATINHTSLSNQTLLELLTERVKYVVDVGVDPKKGLKNYHEKCRVIYKNCTVRMGRTVIFVNIPPENISKLNNITSSVKSLLEKVYLYDSQKRKFSIKINVSSYEPNTSRFKINLLKAFKVTSANNIRYIYFVSEGAPNKSKIIQESRSRTSNPPILRAGGINEAFFEFLILDKLQSLKEIKEELGSIFPENFNNQKLFLKLKLSGTSSYATIGPILNAETTGSVTVGGLQGKPDSIISTTTGRTRISIKQVIHPEWSSAQTYEGAKIVIDYLTSNGIISYDTKGYFKYKNQSSSTRGIALLATYGEIKKYCFADDEVDFIIKHDFDYQDVVRSKLIKGEDSSYYIVVEVDHVYSNSSKGINNLIIEKEVYLKISQTNTKSSSMLPGYRINFVPSDKIGGCKIIPSNIIIPGRL